MRVTISLDDELVKKVRKIAAERGTTLIALVRASLQELVAQHDNSERKRRNLEKLEESFKKLQFNMGERTWRREDLYKRGESD